MGGTSTGKTTGLLVAADLDDTQTYASSITGYRLGPVNAAAESRPWTELVVASTSTVQPGSCEAAVRVTARYGWAEVPTAITEACLLQAARLVMRRDSPFGVAGSPDAGSELRLLAKVDPDVAVMLTPFRRYW